MAVTASSFLFVAAVAYCWLMERLEVLLSMVSKTGVVVGDSEP
jgi:hypothetical protein